MQHIIEKSKQNIIYSYKNYMVESLSKFVHICTKILKYISIKNLSSVW